MRSFLIVVFIVALIVPVVPVAVRRSTQLLFQKIEFATTTLLLFNTSMPTV